VATIAMSLGLSNEQQMIRDVAQRFCAAEMPISKIRARLGQGPTDEYVRRTGELGWYAPFIPTQAGGGSVSGEPVVDAALLAEVHGEHLQPAPSITTHLFAHAVSQFGEARTRAILPAIAAGERCGCFVFAEPGRRWDTRTAVCAVRPARAAETLCLTGLVATASGVDPSGSIVVTAELDGGSTAFVIDGAAPGVRIEVLDGIDPTRPLARLTLESVDVTEAQRLRCGATDLEALTDLGVVLLCAESVGTMRRLFAMTLAYAKARVAFGRTIGSFQAVKHQLADMSLLVELSTAIVDEAVRALQERRPDASELASVAKIYVAESGITVSQGCLQLHGGIGYTWDHDLHLYLRRLAADAALFGSPDWHRERLWRLGHVAVGVSDG
jgi:alkylation response protein AidB-like acyl-CoA dehydrogenase